MEEFSKVMFLIMIIQAAISGAQSFNVDGWANTRLEAEKQTVTNLQFYFHDTLSGKNPSAVRVAQSSEMTNKSLTLFGMVMMADDPLTETPDPKSKLVGRAQGFYGSASQAQVGLIMVFNFGFTEGMYKGSTISILGLNSAMNPVREMAIVGGTGIFRLARGYAIAQTYWFDPATGDAIVGYNVTIVH
ncbi:hypothetical protein EZV62_011785 [Acer yangbiense]|uniref:Dirigent protein n=1 Tax=Acer yangbiense TaxID=1000413 RepID=A0A5C7I697_9ROSI|nr:hypothetical protein EZV62_011785 [Acer yangbiense]